MSKISERLARKRKKKRWRNSMTLMSEMMECRTIPRIFRSVGMASQFLIGFINSMVSILAIAVKFVETKFTKDQRHSNGILQWEDF